MNISRPGQSEALAKACLFFKKKKFNTNAKHFRWSSFGGGSQMRRLIPTTLMSVQ